MCIFALLIKSFKVSQDNVWIESAEGQKKCKLIAVHAGFQQNKPVEMQLKLLKSKDTSKQWLKCIQDKDSVWDMPEVFY